MPLEQPPQALIFFAHGSRNPAWASAMERLREMAAERSPTTVTRLAFLETQTPSLEACVAELVGLEMTRIRVVPLFMASSGHLTRDLPALLEMLGQRFPQVALELLGPVGEAPEVMAAMAAYALGPVA